MIVTLIGELIEQMTNSIVILVQGVGYEVFVSTQTLCALPAIGAEVKILTHLVTREDLQQLYGFLTAEERIVFTKLIKISGVGPKMALAILSHLTVTEFVQCVQAQNSQPLVAISGVGPKTAQRLLLEIQGKLPENLLARHLDEVVLIRSPQAAHTKSSQEAMSALLSLGYKQKEAQHALQTIQSEGLTVEVLIKKALQYLS